MRLVANALVVLLVLFHLSFFVLETFLWEAESTAHVRQDLGFSSGNQGEVAKVAKNQGVSNAFLALGLAWGLIKEVRASPDIREWFTFFLGCVVIAGVVGWFTLRPPGLLAQLAFLLGQTGLGLLALTFLWTGAILAAPSKGRKG